LAGGEYVLTAAHCADDFTAMTVNFGWYNGVAAVTRTVAVGAATVHPLWAGANVSLDAGSDIALLKLNAPVTGINGYNLSTTNDVGKNFLMAGYGTTSVGSSNVATNWGDGNFGHYGYNTVDVDSKTFNATLDNYVVGWGYDASFYVGLTYMSDYDHASGALANNTLARVAAVTGNAWSSNSGLGNNEALIAGGDSGGGDFVWSGSEWLLSGVHSWGWGGNNPCGAVGLAGCDIGTTNGSSYGDLSGSTAVVSHLSWIASTINPVPEPGTWALMLAGMASVGSLAKRRNRRS
jgi:Trypsin/PEP-CTERM motif